MTGAFNIRVGEGWDVHQLVAGRKLILGGIEVPHVTGLLGHSDADVLLHAITDAQYRGADSLALLSEATRRVKVAGWQVGNVDATVIAQAPKLAPHIPLMCQRIADTLGVALEQVNVKAKTAEKLGPVGEGRAMEARAAVLLHR